MSSLCEDLHEVTLDVTAELNGEPVTIRHRDGIISTEISDAIVGMNPPAGVGIDAGKAEYSGVVRLRSTHRTAALLCLTATVRGQVWHILSVGDVFAGWFRVEISREDQNHSNMFDINDQQAVWYGE